MVESNKKEKSVFKKDIPGPSLRRIRIPEG